MTHLTPRGLPLRAAPSHPVAARQPQVLDGPMRQHQHPGHHPQPRGQAAWAARVRWTGAALCLALLAAVWAQPSRAALTLGTTSTEAGRRIVVAQPVEAPASAPALSLVRAVLGPVDLAAGVVTVAGQRVLLHPESLRVIGPSGQTLGVRALQAGQQVRLALEPAAPEVRDRRVVLIYIDAQR